MPNRSHVSFATAEGSFMNYDDREGDRPTSSSSAEKTIALSPLSLSRSRGNVDGEPSLPPPVLHDPTRRRSSSKKLCIAGQGLGVAGRMRTHWTRFLRKVGNGTAPSSSSAFDDTASQSTSRHQQGQHNLWHSQALNEDPDELLDEIVIDREWGEELQRTTSPTHSEHGGGPEKSGGSNHVGGTNTDRDSVAMHIHPEGFWSSCVAFTYLRWRIWPFVVGFFWTRFLDDKSEDHYKKENWFLRKKLAIWSSLFFYLNWALAAAILPRPYILPDWIFYFCITPALTFPLLLMVIYDFPRDRHFIYQIFLLTSTWSWGIYQLVSINICHFYHQNIPTEFPCNGKDFLSTFYYTSALQTIALFGLKLHRFPALVGMISFFVVSFVLVVPDRTAFIRNVVNFFCFQTFLLYMHYMRENSERRLYTLRDQLKVQFRATQKAQVNERKAADSKRRLTSYVFHEVRVPLNTALLAVQNMEASGTVPRTQEIEFKALEGSLSMMSKVLNDMLDFNRMDSGRFESVARPYAFHKVMRSLFVPLKLATDARQLRFVTDLDSSIDTMARRALYDSMGVPEQEVEKRLLSSSDEDGIVVGDETRLRQIITNLASNACKFTPAGGQVTIMTRLILPERTSKNNLDESPSEQAGSSTVVSTPGKDDEELHLQLSMTHLSQHNHIHSSPPPPLECVVVRIEVSDTGCGIRRKDMIDSKLFSAFNQTEIGRQQGGKGTGLGLALVRQIVKLSGGRLGVRSKVNEGSTFWVEIPLGVGSKAQPGLEYGGFGQDISDMDMSMLLGGGDDVPLSASRNQDAQSSHRPHTRSMSAMHSIMEQGGLVELSTRRNDDSPVVTRTIGDPLTGTEPVTPGVQDDNTSPARSLFELPTPTNAGTRPRYVELPARQDFSEDNSSSEPTSPTSPSTLGRLSGSVVFPSTSPANEPLLRVLVVDDDPLTRKLMSRMLTRMGCKVATAVNGEIALEMILGTRIRATPSSEDTGSGGLCADNPGSYSEAHEYRYAVVFLDNQMPVMSGLETVAKLRELGRKDFVVGVTGNALLTDQQEYFEAGVDHILTKPVFEKSIRSMLVVADERRKRAIPVSDPPDQS